MIRDTCVADLQRHKPSGRCADCSTPAASHKYFQGALLVAIGIRRHTVGVEIHAKTGTHNTWLTIIRRSSQHVHLDDVSWVFQKNGNRQKTVHCAQNQ